MSNIKSYSSKSNAKRAAKAAGLDMETAVLVEVEGQYHYVAAEPVVAEAPSVVNECDAGYIAKHGFCHCPRCNVHLSNGVMDFTYLADERGYAKAYEMQGHEFACMACDFEWGNEVAEPGARKVPTGTGIKIEKNRAEQNGVTRPSQGGVCAAIWAQCDALSTDGTVPAVKVVKAWAAEQGIHPTTCMIQYYQWRKYMGVVGRMQVLPTL